MSLTRKPTMTTKRLAASQANGRRSHTRQAENCEAQRKAILKESMAGPSPYERAAEIALAHPHAALMQRMEESSFRQIWRITTLLLKTERQGREAETQ
jgi:DNA-binding TFAR19-related protein (PDSD5 family)